MSDTEQPSRFLNDEWVAYLDDSGEEYYYNLYTAETTWDLPDIEDKTCDLATTETKDSVQPELSKQEASPASHDSPTVNNKQLGPAAVNEDLAGTNIGSKLPAPAQPPTPVNRAAPIVDTVPEVVVTEKSPTKPQKPPKALKALLVAKSTTKIDTVSVSEEASKETKTDVGALVPPTAADEKGVEINTTEASATEEQDAAAKEPATEAEDSIVENVVKPEEGLDGHAASVELETEDVPSTTATESDVAASNPPTEQPAPAVDNNKTPAPDTIYEVVESGANEVSTENEPESPSVLQARVTSTGKVSALAKMFSSRPSSNNNMKPIDPLSPQGDRLSPVRSPSNSAKNAGLWGPSVRNKSSFASKSPQKTSSSGSVLFMTPSSPKSKGKRSVSQDSPEGNGQDVSAEADDASRSEKKSSDEPCAAECAETALLASSEEIPAVFEGKDSEDDTTTNVSVQPAVAVKVKPPRPPPPSSPRPPSVAVRVVVENETTEPLAEQQEELEVIEASAACGVQSEDPPASSDTTEKPQASEGVVGAGTVSPQLSDQAVCVEASSESEEPAQSPVPVEAAAPPVLQRAASAPVESYTVDPTTEVPPAASDGVSIPVPVAVPAQAVRSASVPESMPTKIKPPKPPKNISAKVTTTTVVSPVQDTTTMTEPTVVVVPSEPVGSAHSERPLSPLPLANNTAVAEPAVVQAEASVSGEVTEQAPAETEVIAAPSPSFTTTEVEEIVEKDTLHEVPVESDVEDLPAVAPVVAPVVTTRSKAKTYKDASDSDSDYGEIELEIFPSQAALEEEVVTTKTGQDDAVAEVLEEVQAETEPPAVTELEMKPVVGKAVEMTELKSEIAPTVAVEISPLPTQQEVSVEASVPVVSSPPKKATVVKPPKPAKRVPPASPVLTVAAAVSVVSVDSTVPAVSGTDPLPTSATPIETISSEANITAELAAQSLPPPPPPPPRDTESTPVGAVAVDAVVTPSAAVQPSDAQEHTAHSTDANLAAELAALEIEVDLSDNVDIGSDTSSVYPAGHAAELKAALEAIEILAGEIELDETEEMGAEDEYSSSREKHESLHLPPPPSLSPPPPPPAQLQGSPSGIKASAVVNPFEDKEEEEEQQEQENEEGEKDAEETDQASHPAVAVNCASLAVDYAHGTPNAPGTGKIGAGRTMGTWNSHPTPADATVSGTHPVPASGKRAMGQWDQQATLATPPTVSEPPVKKESAFSAHLAKNPPLLPTAKAIPSYSPAAPPAPAPVAAVAVSSSNGRSMGAWGGASPLTAPANDVNPRYTQHRGTSSSGATSREASPAPGARQMSPLLAIALSKKAEAARNRSPQPMQSASRNSSVGEFSPHDNDFDGFDGGRASDVHSMVGYKGVPITHGHGHGPGLLQSTFGGPSAVGGSMGSPYHSPEGSTRDDAPQGYLQRTNTGQVRKRNPRPSEVLTGLDEGMEALNSIVLKKLMRIGVKYLPAKEALQRCVSNNSAVNHYYNALSLVRTSMLAGLGMDPYGAQLWSPRITSRIKSWLPNLLDGETKDFHTGYIMLVSYQRLADNQLISWQLTLRYSVFRNLNTKIAKYISGTSVDSRVHFPSKVTTFFTGITDKVRNERMNQLDLWMREILNSALVMTIPEVADALLEVLEVESRVSD